MNADCKICTSPHQDRIDGWILSGLSYRELKGWSQSLDPPMQLERTDVEVHLDGGHISLDKPKVVAMLVKYNREAEEIIDECMNTTVARPRSALNTALQIRMRTIELLAKVAKVVDSPQTVENNLNLLLDPDSKRRMLEHALKVLPVKPDGSAE